MVPASVWRGPLPRKGQAVRDFLKTNKKINDNTLQESARLRNALTIQALFGVK